MYEMKGALSGCGPGSASFPASRLRVSQSPGLTVPDRLVSQPHQSRSTGHPASLFRFVRLPGLPGATRRPPVPDTRCKFRFPGLYIARGIPPGWCPFPAVKVFLRPPPHVAQEPTAIHFRFFPRPHLVHRIPPVIRTSRQLSTALCTATPQVTRRNSENTSDDRSLVFTPSFPCDSPLIPNSPLYTCPGPLPLPPPASAAAWRAAAGARPSPAECPGKSDCPVSGIGLPWIHDLSPGAEAARIPESGTAAFGCPGRRSGCLVSANRHVPAAAPGKSPFGAVSFTSGRIDRPNSLSHRLDN
jgi:hypothetical protein